MSIVIDDKKKLDEVVKSSDSVFVLFYASWCPYSRAFLPEFEKYAKDTGQDFVFAKADDNDELCEKYNIEVFPSVCYFEKGKVSKTLHGIAGKGLTGKNLETLIIDCKK